MVFQITIVCDHGHRFIGQLDSQRSITDPRRGNVTSIPQPFTFGPQILVVQAFSLSETGSYLFAGKTCICYKYKLFEKAENCFKQRIFFNLLRVL